MISQQETDERQAARQEAQDIYAAEVAEIDQQLAEGLIDEAKYSAMLTAAKQRRDGKRQ